MRPSTLSGGVGMYLFINLLNDLTIRHHSREVPKFCQVKRIMGFESFVLGQDFVSSYFLILGYVFYGGKKCIGENKIYLNPS